MADGMYVAMTGAVARSAQLDSIADNLANAQTPGFKAARPAFESFLAPQEISRDFAFTAAVSTGTDTRPGATTSTGNTLDVNPANGAFLSVRLADGSTAYTRNGKLSVDASGWLQAGTQPVLSRSGQPISIAPGAMPSVDINGVVRASGAEVDTLGLHQLSGPVDRLGASLLSVAPGGVATPVDGQLRIGELELGNSTALEATVELVGAQRHFETSMQAISTYRRLDERANELGRIR